MGMSREGGSEIPHGLACTASDTPPGRKWHSGTQVVGDMSCPELACARSTVLTAAELGRAGFSAAGVEPDESWPGD